MSDEERPIVPIDPWEITPRESEPSAESGSPSRALQPASPSRSLSVRGHFGKAMTAAALGVELYQWSVGHGFDRAPWWGAPLALCLTMLPYGVWERLGKVAIEAVAARLTDGKR